MIHKATGFRIITTGKCIVEVVSNSCYELTELGCTLPVIIDFPMNMRRGAGVKWSLQHINTHSAENQDIPVFSILI
jgi:hypothetical protein